MKRLTAIVPVLLATVATVAGLGRLAQGPRPGTEAALSVGGEGTTTAPPLPALVATPAGQIVEPALERLPLSEARRRARLLARDPAALSGFLAVLEHRAREQGAVTNHDLDPGLAAIEAALASLGPDAIRREVDSFRGRMIDLSRALAERRSSDSF